MGCGVTGESGVKSYHDLTVLINRTALITVLRTACRESRRVARQETIVAWMGGVVWIAANLARSV